MSEWTAHNGTVMKDGEVLAILHGDNDREDAEKMAAAPEMYNALLAIENVAHSEGLSPIFANIHAALAKARGV